MNWRHSFLAVPALLAAGLNFDATQPLDGGNPLRFEDDPEILAMLAKDPCQRREKGGWHRSIGHCREMTPPRRITGVWVIAFEERSFLVGETRVPDPNDPRRYEDEIEMDIGEAFRLARRPPADAHGDAYLLTFIGRRTRDPTSVDCTGVAAFGFVVDRLLGAKYLGPMRPLDVDALKARALRMTVARRHGGVWGQMEEKAIETCAPQGRD